MSGDGVNREDDGLSPPQDAQAVMQASSASKRRRRPQRASNPARLRLSELLSNNLVSAGKFATGRTIDPRKPDPSMPQACMPRIKHKAMSASLTLPLGGRQAEKLKAAQVNAGQERDVNVDGVPEKRLPWAVRPDVDFKIVNHKAWSTGVVAPVVAQVKEALGFGEWEVEASLSEMLLCEEDCFYRWGSQQH
ncbi:unnamed protein product [Ectocarpus sp. CCAP 1310/34]|nr:unnamed protein product [Ectocarpus sp. CCAP 1310/34]